MNLKDFEYFLPPELIARFPLKERTASRLLCLNGQTGVCTHRQFSELPSLVGPNDLLVCNNSKVIPARLWGQKATGGKIEVLVERILDEHRFLAHIRASKSPKPGSLVILGDVHFKVLGRRDDLFELECDDARPVLTVIEAIGEMPLPPYFNREPVAADSERYQTVYADPKGSVAAPTAGLHFDGALLNTLQAQGVNIAYLTLHVGSGTFVPVRVDDIKQHKMHAEYVEVAADLCEKVKATRAKGGRVIAVGTTSVRGLESASNDGEIKPYCGDTSIFIYPGYEFRSVDRLITNLHLPHSTLLMLVAAFGGYDNVMAAYREAVQEKYRFFSYGDAMWIEPGKNTVCHATP